MPKVLAGVDNHPLSKKLEFQNFKNKDVCPTLLATEHKAPKCIAVKTANKKGYDEAVEGDSVNLQYPESKTRRGRVGHGVSQTLQCNDSMGVVIAGGCDKRPVDRNYNRNGTERKEQIEIRKDELSNTILTVHQHNMVTIEDVVTAAAMRGRENGQQIEVSDREYSNALTTVQKDCLVAETKCLNSKVNGKQPHVQDRIYDSEGISTAITTAFRPSIAEHTKNLRIRKLTPKECWRLMGFSDECFEKAQKVNSNTQLYKQAGNSIVVDVLVHIFRNLLLKQRRLYQKD